MVVLGLTGRLANRYAMLLVAIRAKNVSPLHWLLVLGLMGRVANRVCGVAGCDRGEKYFGCTLGCALGGRAIKYGVHVGDRLTMRQPSAQGL